MDDTFLILIVSLIVCAAIGYGLLEAGIGAVKGRRSAASSVLSV